MVTEGEEKKTDGKGKKDDEKDREKEVIELLNALDAVGRKFEYKTQLRHITSSYERIILENLARELVKKYITQKFKQELPMVVEYLLLLRGITLGQIEVSAASTGNEFEISIRENRSDLIHSITLYVGKHDPIDFFKNIKQKLDEVIEHLKPLEKELQKKKEEIDSIINSGEIQKLFGFE